MLKSMYLSRQRCRSRREVINITSAEYRIGHGGQVARGAKRRMIDMLNEEWLEGAETRPA